MVSGCHTKTVTDNENENIFKYKNAYVGDNSAVIHIVNQTMSSKKIKDIELKTQEKPYGIILSYDGLD